MSLCIDCEAYAEYDVTGSTDTFTFPFEYVIPDDIRVAVRNQFTREYEDIPRSAWTFENLSTIKVTPAPRADVIIYRCTDITQPAATFFPGNSIKAEDLNSNQTQVLNAIKELRCAIADCCSGGGGGTGPGPGEPCENGICAPGLVCVDGICLELCPDGICPIGYTCVEGICLPDCVDEADCPTGFTCVGDVCVPECDDDGLCPSGFECVEGVCLPECDDGICPSEFECVEGICLPECDEGICPSGFECVEGICVPECGDDGVCPEGFTCTGGICLPNCSDDGLCPTGFICVDGTCLPDCSDDGVCPTGFICIDGICQPDEVVDAPSDGRLYGRQDAEWKYAIHYDFTKHPELAPPNEEQTFTTTIGTANLDFEDAPSDGDLYGRINASWSPALLYNLSELPLIGVPETEDPCEGVTCGAGEICVNGICVPDPCAGVTCPEGEICVNGVCETDLCAGVTCPPGEECVQGVCEPIEGLDPCEGVDCGQFETCVDGVCVETVCIGVTCPEGQICVGGNCEPDPGSFNLETQSIGTAPRDGLMYGRKDAVWSTALQHNISTLTPIPEGTN